MNRSLSSLSFLAAAAVALLAVHGAAQAPVYRAEFIGPGSWVSAMNNDGTVVYRGTVGVVPRAFVGGPSRPGTLLLMPAGLLSSLPTDVSEAGVITGHVSPYTTTAFKQYPALWAPDGAGGYALASVLPLLPGDDRGTADAINDVGDVLGTSSYTSLRHTVLYTPTGPVELPGLGALPPASVNDARVYVSGNALVHLDTLLVETLPVPAGRDAVVGWVVNDAGQVAGELVSSCGTEVAVFTPGAGWEVLGGCGTGNACRDLNAGGDVVMQLDGAPCVRLVGEGLFRIADLIAAEDGEWIISSSGGIALNDARQIAVVASNGAQSGVVLLTPQSTVCQADLGYGGPGTLSLSMCGGDLSTGTSADLVLTGGVPHGVAFLLAGLTADAVPFKGGTLVPVPWALLAPLPLDAEGHVSLLDVSGGSGPVSVYVQAAMQDRAQIAGYAISNALRVDLLP